MSTDTEVTETAPSTAKVSPFATELPVIEISEAALETVLGIRAGEDDAGRVGPPRRDHRVRRPRVHL